MNRNQIKRIVDELCTKKPSSNKQLFSGFQVSFHVLFDGKNFDAASNKRIFLNR